MIFSQLIKKVKQRLELNNWLKQQRHERLDTTGMSEHMRRDLGVYNCPHESEWTREEPARQRESVIAKKERTGPSSA